MSHELSLENVLIQVREYLNTNQVKLWQEPYFVDNYPNESEIEVKSREFNFSRFSKILKCVSL